ncbi:MAG: hypothetical protein K9W44_12900 [Candidatus Lokiarchaeota archaeon]|nr:hypothetical protein [Candidatus Harpocratesius repetitus]
MKDLLGALIPCGKCNYAQSISITDTNHVKITCLCENLNMKSFEVPLDTKISFKCPYKFIRKMFPNFILIE